MNLSDLQITIGFFSILYLIVFWFVSEPREPR